MARTPTSPTEAAPPDAGFTLIELLVVLAILALSATLVVAHMGKRRTEDEISVAVARSIQLLRETRARAVRTGRDQVAYIDVRRGQLASQDGRRRVGFPRVAGVTLTADHVEHYANGLAGVRFFDTGGSSGGSLTVQSGGQSRRIRIDWLTGRSWVDSG